MATGTLSPAPLFYGWDVTTGLPLAGGLLYTYAAGTSTPIATYTDVALLVPNTNPVVLNSAGYAVVYLVPGTAYKYVLKTSAGVTEWTLDNIAAVPTASPAVDVASTFGENVAAGQSVYLSDGSGGKTAGQWYLTSAANAYSSTLPVVGFVLAAYTSGQTGTVRTTGGVTGLASLTVGGRHYLSVTPGAITATAPVLARFVGVADTATSLVALANPPLGLTPIVNDFRLTLTTALPVTTADVTAATTLYWTPYTGNRCTVFESTGTATILSSAQLSIAIPATTSTLYDVFVYNNGGTAALELLAWTNDTTRATAIVRTGAGDAAGVWTKSGDPTRRYVGSMRTTTVSGQTEDSLAKRYVWNLSNHVHRPLRRLETTASWTYTTATLRQANGSTANQVEVVVGVARAPVSLTVMASVVSTVTCNVGIGIGTDSTTTVTPEQIGGAFLANTGGNTATATAIILPSIGRHFFAWLETSQATNVTTWGLASTASGMTATGVSGLSGWIEG